MHTSFEDAVEAITQKHPEYTPEAYFFMRDAMDYATEQINKETEHPNLSAEELYLSACAYALDEYGPLARKVLETWGISSSTDFGSVVYNLIEASVFGKQKDDSPSDFDHLEPLEHLLNTPFELPDEVKELLAQAEHEAQHQAPVDPPAIPPRKRTRRQPPDTSNPGSTPTP